jgi:transposase
MESTSVYWIPVYQILEFRGLEVGLVSAQRVKNVPGSRFVGSDLRTWHRFWADYGQTGN